MTFDNLHGPHITIVSNDIEIPSLSGNDIRATISINQQSLDDTAVILCPGFAVGKEGDFVKSMEKELFAKNKVKYSIRFNFSGLENDGFNEDLRGFTFENSVHDFQAMVKTLRELGADHIVAIGSSTGVQPAVLASCQGGNDCADLIIGRSSVLDCFQSILPQVIHYYIKEHGFADEAAVLANWEEKGSFQFLVDDKPVTLGYDLYEEVSKFDLKGTLAELQTPVKLLHGKKDKTVPITVLESAINNFPKEMREYEVLIEADHGLSNDPDSYPFKWIIEAMELSNID